MYKYSECAKNVKESTKLSAELLSELCKLAENCENEEPVNPYDYDFIKTCLDSATSSGIVSALMAIAAAIRESDGHETLR